MSSFFSIVIPTYNRAQLIVKAIESVLQQTFSDWELIIVDDGSTDNTKDVVQSYSDKRIIYLYQKNAERSEARNNGIRNATGQYICFLDSDDYYMPDRLLKLHTEILKHPEKIVVYYTGIAYSLQGNITNRPQLPNTFKNINDFLVLAVIGTPQVCIHHSILLHYKFNTTIIIGEDMELWLRIASQYPFIYLDNQYTIVALDHEDRSVNNKRYNVYFDTLQLFKEVFNNKKYGYNIAGEIKAKIISNCHYGIAIYFIHKGNKFYALKNLFRSVVAYPRHIQTKFRLNIIRYLIGKNGIEMAKKLL